MSIGTRLKHARREADLSQLKAAAELGTEQSAIWRYEADRQAPSDSMLERLAALYNKSPDWFHQEGDPEDSPGPDEDEPIRSPSTRWVLKRTGLTVMLSIECNPRANPEHTYYWHSDVHVEDDGFIRINRAWLQSIDDTMAMEMHPKQQAIWDARPGRLHQIKPQDLENTCNKLAEEYYELSQRMEAAPEEDEENEAALTRENEVNTPEVRKRQSLDMIDRFESKTTVLGQDS